LLAPVDNPFATSPIIDRRLVWTMGFRNPFRFHIDPTNGIAYVADVGLTTYEEIDRVATPAKDFGWPYYEGPMVYATCGGIPASPGLEPPIYSYFRGGNTAAVIGAGVYRGSACTTCNFPSSYNGDYFFSDFYLGFLRRLRFSSGSWSIAPPVPGQPNATDWGTGFEEIADFLNGPDGALWYCRMASEYQPGTGEIGRIYYATVALGVDGEGTAASVVFAPPYPSPAHDMVHFAYDLPAVATVDISVFDVAGRMVRSLLPATRQSVGRHHLAWDGRSASGTSVAPGVYLARLRVDGKAITRRVVLSR
jgi:hypothetical protein